MLLTFLRWWTAQLAELLYAATKWSVSGLAGGVVVSYLDDGEPAATIRRRERSIPVSLVTTARLSRRRRVILCAPANIVLVRRHVIPAMAARDATNVLRHELSRLSPFTAEELFWQWAIVPERSDQSGMEVTLTMVPKVAIRPALARLQRAGLSVDVIEAAAGGPAQWLPVRTGYGPRRRLLARALTWANICLALAALGIPVARQALALRRVETDIAALQPAIAEVRTLRQTMAANTAWRDTAAQEERRLGDAIGHLATLTRLLPDDTYLANIAVQQRHVVMNGQSGSAARLIGILSDNAAIANAAFAAPVMRADGATFDTFMITATLMP